MSPPATSTLAQSVLVAVAAFAAAAVAAGADATAVHRVVYGLAAPAGQDYGRYFAQEDPLEPFSAAADLPALIAAGASSRATLAAAAATAEADATGNPAAFPADVLALCEALRAACADPRDGLRLLASLAAFNAPTLFDGPSPAADPGASQRAAVYFAAGAGHAGQPLLDWKNWLFDPIGVQISALSGAAGALIRRAVAISLARTAATYVPLSYDDAAAAADLVAGVLDDAIAEAGDRFDDASYMALTSLETTVVEDLRARGGSAAPVRHLSLGASRSALALAYELYQDAGRAGEILARNDCPHPAFLPAQLEVLTA